MLRLLRQLFRSSHPLDADNLGDQARDVNFREIEDADIPTCLAIYRANEAAHFPAGHYEQYEKHLHQRASLTLLASRQGKPVGCCGIRYATSAEGLTVGVLCYGMVDPAHQRQGIGTAQLLVRLALLPVADDLGIAIMLAVPNSVSFYRRFGFRFETSFMEDAGMTYEAGTLKVSESFLDDCRVELAKRRIVFPDVRDRIPRQTQSE